MTFCRAFAVKVATKTIFPFSGLLKGCKGHKTHRFENGGTNQIRKTGKREVGLLQPLPQTLYQNRPHLTKLCRFSGQVAQDSVTRCNLQRFWCTYLPIIDLLNVCMTCGHAVSVAKWRRTQNVLNLRTTTSQKCAAVPKRARI